MGNSQYLVSAQCLSCGSNALHGPYLQPTNFDINSSAQLVIYVAYVDGPNAQTAACVDNSANPDFKLKWVKNSVNIVFAQVIVQSGNVLSDDPARRAALRKSFASFRASLQTWEASQCLIPGGSDILANRIASALPLRLDEILYYYYGFDPVLGIELHPGMRLALESGAYQYIAPAGSQFPGAELNAFVSHGQAYYNVSLHSSQQTLSFNNYLSSLNPFGLTSASPEIANVIDLAATSATRRYYRLIYPSQFLSPTDISQDSGLQYNVTLIGADDLADLEAAAGIYVTSKTCAPATPGNVVCSYFSGRGSVIPEIPIIFQGMPMYVPVGTTYRNLLQNYMVLAPGEIAGYRAAVLLSRYAAPVLMPASSSSPPQQPITQAPISVVFDISNPNGMGIIPDTGLSIWDIPLVMRDQITWSWNQ